MNITQFEFTVFLSKNSNFWCHLYDTMCQIRSIAAENPDPQPIPTTAAPSRHTVRDLGGTRDGESTAW